MQIGTQAPHLDLEAIATGRRFILSEYRDRTVLLIFVYAYEARSTRDVVITVRRQFPDYNHLPIAIVINLSVVPRLLRGTVTGFMKAAYQEAAADIPSEYNPADHLILLPDWTGAITRNYGINHSVSALHLVVIDAEQKIGGAFYGKGATERVIDIIRGYSDAE